MKRSIHLTYASIVLLLTCVFIDTFAQNLEEISLRKPPKINGSINLSAVGYNAFGIPQRRDPFNWFMTGSLNINLFGYNAPFSFSYSNANKNFSQPFNQFHFAPQYKWIKTYTGYTSMTFSPYTLAGHIFFGGGVELTPGKWKIAAMYGRINKAVPFDLNDSTQFNKASFKRMGYGLKLGYESGGDAVTFNIFEAKDDPESIPFVLPENKITPEQNVAMSLAVRKTFLKAFFVNAEYAISVLNTNTRADNERDTVSLKPTHNLIKGLVPENSTTRYFDAISSSIGYQGSSYTIQLKYERIAPEYQTLGAYYFNNDMRNITVATNVRLLHNKLNLAANVGEQENNLDKTRSSTLKRTVVSSNATFTPGEKWNFAGGYSNFLSFTNVRPQSDPFYSNTLDTLNFYQVSETMNATATRMLGTKDNPQSLMVTSSFQRASNKASGTQGAQISNFLNSTVAYSYSLKQHDLTLAVAANMFKNNVAGINTTFFGPSVNATKFLIDRKLRTSYVTSYNHTMGGGIATSPVWTNQFNLSYTPPKQGENAKGKSALSLGVNLLKRLKQIGEQPAFTELTGTINYSYSF
jgi:hypothetical protein